MRDRRTARCTCGTPIRPESTKCAPCHAGGKRGMRGPNTLADPVEDAERGSRELLRRQLVAGQHWLVDPARFAAACASVGL